MIGRKESSKENVNANNEGDTNPSGTVTASTGSTTFDQNTVASVTSTNTKGRRSKKPLFIAIAILAIAAIGACVYFLVLKKDENSGSDDVVITEGIYASGPNASENIQKQLDDKIAKSNDTQEVIDAKFSKISFMIMDEEFETALTSLNEIDSSNLSDYNQYRLYNYYTTVYKYLGNGTEADRYQNLADEAHERDLSTYNPE